MVGASLSEAFGGGSPRHELEDRGVRGEIHLEPIQGHIYMKRWSLLYPPAICSVARK